MYAGKSFPIHLASQIGYYKDGDEYRTVFYLHGEPGPLAMVVEELSQRADQLSLEVTVIDRQPAHA